MKGKQFIINESLVNGILDYLITRPYLEVAGGVQGLQHLEELKQPEETQLEEKISE